MIRQRVKLEESKKMAEAPDLARELESAGVPIVEESEDNSLHTVDLQTPRSAAASQPTLQFSDMGPQVSHFEEPLRTHESPIEGTHIEERVRTSSKGAQLKEWGVFQIRVTKQLVSEKFGRATRTVDTNLDTRIESLRETQKKYAQLMFLAAQFQTHFGQVVETQKSLAEHFAFMSVRSPELHTEFHYNSDTQKLVARNGETLLAAVQFFISNMQTVCTKTMEDTLQTVKGYEASRLSYDAYRNDLEESKKQANTSEKVAARLPAATAEFERHKARFEQLRNDVDIKLKLLDENKLKVTHKQLVLLQGAFAAYFSGNHETVDALLKELRAKLNEDRLTQDPPAWLEDLPSPRELRNQDQ